MAKKKVFFITLSIVFAFFLASNFFVSKVLIVNRVVVVNNPIGTVERLINTDSIFKTFCIANNYTPVQNSFCKKDYTYTFYNISKSKKKIDISGKLKANCMLILLPLSPTTCELTTNTSLTCKYFFTRIFTYLKAQLLSKQLDNLLNKIKIFSENNLNIYGFDIKIEKQTEPNVSFFTTTVDSANKYTALLTALNNINYFVEKNKLIKSNPSILININSLQNDSIVIKIGIPTEKQLVQGKFSVMQMPQNGNMLVAEYKGRYKNKTSIYTAMENYIEDNDLSIAALQYEKFNNSNLPTSDSSVVNFTMCFPIF